MPPAPAPRVRSFEPRPSAYEDLTIAVAVDRNREALLAWIARHGYGSGEDGDTILFAFTDAMVQAKADPARAARLCELVYGWRVDASILWHLEVVKKNIPTVLKLRVMRWVLRTGYRFPAKSGDLIVFLDQQNMHRTARVVTVDNSTCSASIQAENGFKGNVLAEAVIENRTQTRNMVPLTVPEPMAWQNDPLAQTLFNNPPEPA